MSARFFKPLILTFCPRSPRSHPSFFLAQVNRELRHIINTDPPPGSYGPILIDISATEFQSIVWSSNCVRLSAVLQPRALMRLRDLFSGKRSRRFSSIEVRISKGKSNAQVALLCAALLMLEAGGYDGRLLVAGLPKGDIDQVDKVIDIAKIFWTSTHIDNLDLSSIPRYSAQGADRILRIAATKIVGIENLRIVTIPDGFSLGCLSGLTSIAQMYVGPRWKDWAAASPPPLDTTDSLAQISTLQCIEKLDWTPMISGPGADSLSNICSLADLELHCITVRGWNDGIRSALAALTKLTGLSLNVWDPALTRGRPQAIAGPDESLSDLGPLFLPASLREFVLWFRIHENCRELNLDFFEPAAPGASLQALELSIVGVGRARQAQDPSSRGLEVLSVTLGSSLLHLSCLTQLRVSAFGGVGGHASMYFPNLSCMTRLASLETVGSCGIHRIPAMPSTWVVKGIHIKGEQLPVIWKMGAPFCLHGLRAWPKSPALVRS